MIYKAKGNMIFGGVNLLDYDAFAISCNVFERPLRDTTKVIVPGRNGELLYDNGRYQDVNIEYTIVVNGQGNADNLLAALLTVTDIARLEDTYEPDVYKVARITAAPIVNKQNDVGCRIVLKMTRKPQRFLKLGEQTVTVTSTGTLHNPTLYTALPLVRAYGNGTLAIGSETITVAGVSQAYIDIDCDIQDAYNGTTNLNGNVTLSSGEFFSIPSGDTGVTVTGFSSVVITPRWWTL